jgi:DNA-binding response OmpR family regulator
MNDVDKIKILIVEDEVVINKVYREGMSAEGFSVISAMNGKDGLEIALKEKPDIILLDILMPVMDGLTMMQKLRDANSYGKSVPIILLTNLSAGEDKIMSAITKNEPAYYLVKSDWNLSDVIDKVRERLRKHQ